MEDHPLLNLIRSVNFARVWIFQYAYLFMYEAIQPWNGAFCVLCEL